MLPFLLCPGLDIKKVLALELRLNFGKNANELHSPEMVTIAQLKSNYRGTMEQGGRIGSKVKQCGKQNIWQNGNGQSQNWCIGCLSELTKGNICSKILTIPKKRLENPWFIYVYLSKYLRMANFLQQLFNLLPMRGIMCSILFRFTLLCPP